MARSVLFGSLLLVTITLALGHGPRGHRPPSPETLECMKDKVDSGCYNTATNCMENQTPKEECPLSAECKKELGAAHKECRPDRRRPSEEDREKLRKCMEDKEKDCFDAMMDCKANGQRRRDCTEFSRLNCREKLGAAFGFCKDQEEAKRSLDWEEDEWRRPEGGRKPNRDRPEGWERPERPEGWERPEDWERPEGSKRPDRVRPNGEWQQSKRSYKNYRISRRDWEDEERPGNFGGQGKEEGDFGRRPWGEGGDFFDGLEKPDAEDEGYRRPNGNYGRPRPNGGRGRRPQ